MDHVYLGNIKISGKFNKAVNQTYEYPGDEAYFEVTKISVGNYDITDDIERLGINAEKLTEIATDLYINNEK
jgi:hypothetical protein